MIGIAFQRTPTCAEELPRSVHTVKERQTGLRIFETENVHPFLGRQFVAKSARGWVKGDSSR